MTWYAIRIVYHWGQKSDGTNVFEERVVAFSGANVDEAFDKAAKESIVYCSSVKDATCDIHPDKISYELDEANYLDGQEIWSELYQSIKSLSDFYDDRYTAYEYVPE